MNIIQEKLVNNIYVPTRIFRGLLLSLMIEGSGFIAVYDARGNKFFEGCATNKNSRGACLAKKIKVVPS